MEAQKNIYETVFVLHPEFTEEEVETFTQNAVQLLEGKTAEVIRIDRGGKRRLAYVMRKQRYGYYTLIHFRGTPAALPELERTYRLNDRVLRYLTVRFDKEEQLTGFTRVPDDDGREDDRDDRRRGGRRGDMFSSRGDGRYPRRGSSFDRMSASDDDDVSDHSSGDDLGLNDDSD